jgi:hypothetical protein
VSREVVQHSRGRTRTTTSMERMRVRTCWSEHAPLGGCVHSSCRCRWSAWCSMKQLVRHL